MTSYLSAVFAVVFSVFSMNKTTMFDQASSVCESLWAEVTPVFVFAVVVLDDQMFV